MKSTVFIILALFGVVQTNQNCDRKTMNNSEIEAGPTPKAVTKFDRLPENIKLDTQVRKDVRDETGQIISFAAMTGINVFSMPSPVLKLLVKKHLKLNKKTERVSIPNTPTEISRNFGPRVLNCFLRGLQK